MNDTWGSWSLDALGQTLWNDTGYGIDLPDIDNDRDVNWWAEHLAGKGWGKRQVIADFRRAVADLRAA